MRTKRKKKKEEKSHARKSSDLEGHVLYRSKAAKENGWDVYGGVGTREVFDEGRARKLFPKKLDNGDRIYYVKEKRSADCSGAFKELKRRKLDRI